MKKIALATLVSFSIFTLTGCGSTSADVTYSDETYEEEASSDESNSAESSPGNLLSRLNASGSEVWVEDVANDLTGSQSIAVYLTGTTEGCAVWVFDNESIAQSNLDNGVLQFDGAVFAGADSQSNLGIIFIAPQDNSPCTYNVAEVLGWGY
jgi:hypothetical protein